MASMTVDEWCKEHRVSRSMYYKLKSGGKGPRTIKIGSAVRITQAADSEWVAAREAESAKGAIGGSAAS